MSWMHSGTDAEYVSVPEDLLALKPANPTTKMAPREDSNL
jgi:hypothetical protein